MQDLSTKSGRNLTRMNPAAVSLGGSPEGIPKAPAASPGTAGENSHRIHTWPVHKEMIQISEGLTQADPEF